jgi:hypothetical protein
MLPVSDLFREIVSSSVRPKCEPTIVVENAFGEGRNLVWEAKNISKMTYKRGIDPLGRSLPFMELRWTEIYKGKLNENSYPQIYEGITEMLPVRLEFKQSYGFTNTWKNIFQNKVTWKQMFQEKKSWRSVRNVSQKETFQFPALFLAGKPTISGSEIEWVAYDFLRFLNNKVDSCFYAQSYFWIIPKVIALNSCSAFLNQKPFVETIVDFVESFNAQDLNEFCDSMVIFDGTANSLIKDWISLKGKYLDFSLKSANVKEIFTDFFDTGYHFGLNFQYENPKITKNENVSSYEFKTYFAQKNEEKKYLRKWSKYKKFYGSIGGSNDFFLFFYVFDKYGEAIDCESDIKRAVKVVAENSSYVPSEEDQQIEVIPIDRTSFEQTIVNDNNGTAYIEDNYLNIYDKNSEEMIAKNQNICKYFNKKSDSIVIKTLPNVSLETGDLITVETNLFDTIGNRIRKTAVIIENELQYNGSLIQTIKAHEVSQ